MHTFRITFSDGSKRFYRARAAYDVTQHLYKSSLGKIENIEIWDVSGADRDLLEDVPPFVKNYQEIRDEEQQDLILKARNEGWNSACEYFAKVPFLKKASKWLLEQRKA